jgi:hypothetical protein
MTFLEKLVSAQKNQHSLLCLGLDVDLNLLAERVLFVVSSSIGSG